MVKFKLVEETEEYLIYWYYPEGDFDKRPGIIRVDRKTGIIYVEKLAEEDWERDIPPEEINQLVDAINQMIKERGGTDFSEYATEPEHSIYYGDHAVKRIRKLLNEGKIPKEGMEAWY